MHSFDLVIDLSITSDRIILRIQVIWSSKGSRELINRDKNTRGDLIRKGQMLVENVELQIKHVR